MIAGQYFRIAEAEAKERDGTSPSHSLIKEGNHLFIRRGDIYYADLSPVIGSEQGGVRPVLVIQNDIGNKFSPTIIISAITSQLEKARLPTHIEISGEHYGLNKNSIVLLEQVRTIDKKRLREKAGHLDDYLMRRVDHALRTSFGLSVTYVQ